MHLLLTRRNGPQRRKFYEFDYIDAAREMAPGRRPDNHQPLYGTGGRPTGHPARIR
ncbi:protein of unknown function [Pseudodesulfovibrio profundus]|uniref:Uncharacterized protein n=1 Tax=Pseudodesulfovibrio profundus TaxID=57320 RepID=A0A2C8FBE2_9BACT|nr:protein of unknown function [Pseudodesulfovibrio profundus]